MASLPPKHLSRSKVRRRRSQLFLTKAPVVPCSKCQAPTRAHRVCAKCGFYPRKNRKSVTATAKTS